MACCLDPEFKSLLKKFAYFLPFLLLGNMVLGMGASLVGPSLPYLSVRADTTLELLGFMITSRSVTFVIASFVTAIIFQRLKYGRLKIIFLAVAVALMGGSMVVIPLSRSYPLLLVAMGGFGIASGMYDTAANSLLVYLFGDIHSRPLLQFLHCFVSFGGFLGPQISLPFLRQMGEIKNQDVYCISGKSTSQSIDANMTTASPDSDLILSSVPPLLWPYVIMSCACGLIVIAYIIIAIIGVNMPRYWDSKNGTQNDEDFTKCPGVSSNNSGELRFRVLILILLFIFYWLQCGKENMYWSHAYSFGICSKLKLSITMATWLNTGFFIGFFVGRFLGIFISHFVRPSIILIVELGLCLVWNIIMSIWGETNVVVAFVTVIGFGFNISMVFGSGISWINSKTDATGFASCTYMIGAYGGISTLPLLAGHLFSTPVGAISLAYLSTGLSVADLTVLFIMLILARYRVYEPILGGKTEDNSAYRKNY